MNAFLQERITGMRIVQIFNAEQQEAEKFRTINRDYTSANLDSVLYYSIFFPVVELISAFSLALMVWIGAGSYLEDKVSFGALVAFPFIWICSLDQCVWRQINLTPCKWAWWQQSVCLN